MNDKFDEVHSLLHKDEYQKALNLLYSSKTEQIKKPFNDDLNHAWYIVGDIFFKNNELHEAIDAFEKSYRYRKEDAEVLWAIATCYSVLNEPKDAEKWYKKALCFDGKNQKLLYDTGNALFDQEKFKNAQYYYESIDRENIELYEMARKNLSACKVRITHKTEP